MSNKTRKTKKGNNGAFGNHKNTALSQADALEFKAAQHLFALCAQNFEKYKTVKLCELEVDGFPNPLSFTFAGDVIGKNRFTGETVTIPAEHASWLLATYSHEAMGDSPDFTAILDHTVNMVSGPVYMAMLD